MEPDESPPPEKRTVDLLTVRPVDQETDPDPNPLRGFATDNRGYFAHREQLELEEQRRRRAARIRAVKEWLVVGLVLALVAAAVVLVRRWR